MSIITSVQAAAVLLLSGACGLLLSPVPSTKHYSFVDFSQTHGREYGAGGAEWTMREEIFKRSKEAIIAHNSMPGRTWKMGFNQFADWTQAEFQQMLGYKPTLKKTSSLTQRREHGNHSLKLSVHPTAVDWTAKCPIASSQVRDQGACGSCWAASSASALECHLEINGQLPAGSVFTDVAVSYQALVSCMPNTKQCGGQGGCKGATAEMAFEYTKSPGLPMGVSYHYSSGTTGEDGACASHPAKVTVDSYVKLKENDLEDLVSALATKGPVVVSVAASSWQLYDSGVYPGCGDDWTLNHAVLAVGYGVDGGQKYWRIKNSWGKRWGENGYIRLQRSDTTPTGTDTKPEEGTACKGDTAPVTVYGDCGILYDSSYPVGTKFMP